MAKYVPRYYLLCSAIHIDGQIWTNSEHAVLEVQQGGKAGQLEAQHNAAAVPRLRGTRVQ